jgi:cell division septation protein DedD
VVASPAPSTGLPQTPSLPAGSAPQPPPKPFYSVQIGAFRNEAIAQDLVKTFLEKGYDAFIQSGVTKDKSPISRVLISKHEDRKAARKLAEEIQSKEKIETTLYGD